MKKVTLETMKKVKRHPDIYSKSYLPHCFVCDEEIMGRGVPLLISHTSHTKTGLPTKIGQLMGDGFMVVVSTEDMVCKRCGALLNHLDKLEADLDIVKRALTGYLKMKYGLLQKHEQIDTQKKTVDSKIMQDVPKLMPDNKPADIEYIISEESNGSEPEVERLFPESSNRKTVEILLENTANVSKTNDKPLNKDLIVSHQGQNIYKCSKCNFKTSELSIFEPHFLACSELPYKCTICEKKFESHKYVRNHIMEAHLSNWTCHFCNKNFREEKDFTSHMKIHLGHNSTISRVRVEETVPLCGSEYGSCDSPQNIQGNFECNICDYQCTNKKIFDNHVRQHVLLKLFQCKVCKESFQNKEELNQHSQEHRTEILKCEMCSAEFDKKENLIQHQQIHVVTESNAGNIYNLEKANTSVLETVLNQTSNGENLNNIIRKPEDVEPCIIPCLVSKRNEIEFHTCHICSLTFVNEMLFIEHSKMHKQNEPTRDLFSQDTSQILQINKVNLDEDSTEHDVHSIDSEGRQQYVEMDDSLEDMFEKLHAETEKTVHIGNINQGKKEGSNPELLQGNLMTKAKCITCQEEFMNEDELNMHKITQMHLDSDPVSELDKVLVEKPLEPIQDKLKENSVNLTSTKTVSTTELVENGLCIETTTLCQNEENTVNNSKDVSVQNNSNGIQNTGNIKEGFINIFDMVREKKLSSNDAEIDHNLLQNMCEAQIKIENEDIQIGQPMELIPYVSSVSDKELQATASSPGQSKKTYVCAMCGFRTPAMLDLRLHFKEHKQKSYSCTICKKVFPNSQKLAAHLRSHERFRGKMTCPYCYEEFPDKYRLQYHLQEKHQKEKVMYKCSFCSETFNTKKAYKSHEEVHPERFSFKCDECDQPFMKEKQLLDHKDASHRDPHCRYCGKEIMKAKTLRNHELRHIREKDSFECDICKRVFKTKTGLRHHVAVHTGEYKYCCDYCGRGFMSRMMMEEHRSMHTKEERYICDVCGRKFSFQSTYWIHRKWHDNPYPYKCSFCGRMFRHSSLLAVHKRKHTGERPYKCPHCPLTFPVGGTLKRHLILHTGVYPFNCESCKRGFTTRHKYATHLAKIHGDFELLNAKTPQGEFKMVIREDPKPSQQPTIWEVDDSMVEQMNFKLEAIAGEDDTSKDPVEDGIACTIVSDDMLVDNIVPTRVVEIVLDETSQAVATVTLAEHANILPDIWYQ